MHRRLRFLMLCLAVCLASAPLMSQKNLIKADRQFELKAFELAIENAKKELEIKPDCIECHEIIAESFRMMNQNVDASIWYRKMEKFEQLPESYWFNYGLLMKKMGQYDKAIKCFENYKEVDEAIAVHFIESCDFAKAVLAEDINFELNLYTASSNNTDFAASIFKDKLVFASFRKDFKRSLEKQNKSIVDPQGPQLFISDLTYGNINAVHFLLHDNEETYDMGPVHYASESNSCVITKNNFNDGEQQIFSNDLELTMFLADVEPDGSFNRITPYPYNEVGYATGFGTLNPAGNILYFASNRPGGYGGFDLYVSYFKDNQWTYPENLGPKINSTGNEVTPYFDGTKLYYSSDYHKGLGGLDVFRSEVHDGRWINPVNMGNGINSPEDDFYFIKHPEKSSYYITSNRIGGKGSYDIYNVIKADENTEVMEVAYEDVAPAEVNIDEDVVEAFDQEAQYTTVKLEEESIIDTREINAEESEIIAETDVEAVEATSESDATIIMEEEIAEIDTETTISEVEATEAIDFSSILPPKAVDVNHYNARHISLVGAKMVAFGEIINDNTNVYFIQLAALFKSSGNIQSFLHLTQFGSLYKMKQSNAIKVKLGYFMDESQAKKVLAEVKKMGYNDAFITFESLNTGRLELVEVSEKVAHNYAMDGFQSDETTGVNFKVRLASYEDPIWFDFNKVKDLGIIEQWTKDQWTIFILSGFSNLDEAQKVKLVAQNRGFRDAEIVLDKNGILERFR